VGIGKVIWPFFLEEPDEEINEMDEDEIAEEDEVEQEEEEETE